MPRAVPAVGPVAALARARRSLFHATAYGSWESILESGLRSAAQILDRPTLRFRERDVVLDAPQGGQFRVRDQRLMAHNRIEDHLDGVDLAGWLRLLDHRVFLFAQQRDLLTHVARTQNTVGQDVVVFDTARLTAAAAGRVEVTLASPAAPDAYGYCPCRGPGLFVPLGAFHGDPADVVDVAVVDGLASVECLVSRVMRYHPGRPPEVLVG